VAAIKHRVLSYVGLGANLDDPKAQLLEARARIAASDSIDEHAFSSLYQSSPMGPPDQPWYLNAVMAIQTDLSAFQLLQVLQAVENELGRVRSGERWGPRRIDLDLLLHGDQQIDMPDLIVPHYGIKDREFVLYPLYEIAPDLFIPGVGQLDELVARCPRNGLEVVSSV
jgi:2-amino-4-hydroxy-6-hydroxymethyldihydropteridine diphosphokinase